MNSDSKKTEAEEANGDTEMSENKKQNEKKSQDMATTLGSGCRWIFNAALWILGIIVILLIAAWIWQRFTPAAAPATDPQITQLQEQLNKQTDTANEQATQIAQLSAAKNAPVGTPTDSPSIVGTPTVVATTDAALAEKQGAGTKTTQGKWEIVAFNGQTDQMKQWMTDLKDLNPGIWSIFPNVDNPKANFKASDGLEYGMAESAYCQQDQRCDVNAPAMHYRIITGDYAIDGVDTCSADSNSSGCGIMLVNVGNITAMFRNVKIDYGWTVEGRYWNGDAIPNAINAGLSHVAYNMLNLPGAVNMGANCSSPGGCTKVRLTFVVLSGNEVLLKGTTTVNR